MHSQLVLDLNVEAPDGRLSDVPAETIAPIELADRVLHPSPVFDTYWRFAAERQAVYEARLAGRPGPWSTDPILSTHRFTNCFRASDRVSQFLIRDVSYAGDPTPTEVVFRTLIFKLFNRISSWHTLISEFGGVRWEEFDFDRYNAALSRAAARGERLYSAAYLMPPPRLGEERKHANHLRLVEMMMNAGLPEKLVDARSLREVFELLRSYPAIGPFLAFQLTIDLNYSRIMDHSESDFVVAGPGARDGIRKCFGRAADGIEEQVIRYMADHQDEHFARLGLSFDGLGHRRPLQLIDCQNLFCEVDKYARVAHPEVEGISGRHRIKQRYRPDTSPLSAWFPPKWGLNDDPVSTGSLAGRGCAGAGHPR